MLFDWDNKKSEFNLKKHQVSFEQACCVWQGEYLEVQGIARSVEGENRNATLGWIDDKVYVVIWTERKGKTRIISARRARKYEEEIFYKSIQDHKRNG